VLYSRLCSQHFVGVKCCRYCHQRLLTLFTLLLLATVTTTAAAACSRADADATATATIVAATATHAQKEKLSKRQREAARVQPVAHFKLQKRSICLAPAASTASLAWTAIGTAASTVVLDQKQQQQQLQAVTVSAVTASGVTVSPAPGLYGMHALNTLYSDLGPAAVRSKLTLLLHILLV
jgi:ABC-type Fe3+-hydroxamate transport system substrate-binding protein